MVAPGGKTQTDAGLSPWVSSRGPAATRCLKSTCTWERKHRQRSSFALQTLETPRLKAAVAEELVSNVLLQSKGGFLLKMEK